MSKYSVALLGCGSRGRHHAETFLKNSDRFNLVALCDKDSERLQSLSSTLNIPKTYTNGEVMLSSEKPDVFCFATLPQVRFEMVELGVKYGVKAISYEKPMATSLAEARRIRDLCREAGVKTIVSHQHKYGSHWQKVKELVDSGWRAVTRSSSGLVCGPGVFDVAKDQSPYVRDLADWLDDPTKIHPCNGEITYHGFELVMGICLSSLERRKVGIPLKSSEPIIERLRRELPEETLTRGEER